MLFNSAEFIPFLLLVLVAHYLIVPADHGKARKLVLVIASYGFYMSWNPFFGLLLAFSTLLDFGLGHAMERSDRPAVRRGLISLSLAGNLGLLGFFKYGAFLGESLFQFAGWDPSAEALGVFRVALPVGISFYTFQTLSYSIDVYRGRQRPTHSLLDFALFVSFFPQLVAGPIVRSRDFLPQLATSRRVSVEDIQYGAMRIAIGLTKKVVLADTLGIYVDRVFDRPELFGWPFLLLGVYAYAYQIYFDFSGYSDIAIGLGRWFGLRIPENFNHPYLASSPREFWQRWHISLSTWLRDYLYISMGGNRGTVFRTNVNLFLTMLLGGLWHGAGWNFIAWGAFHGILLGVHRALFGRDPSNTRLPLAIRRFAMFHLVCFGWLLFRSPTLGDFWTYVTSFTSSGFGASREGNTALAIVVVAALLQTLTSAPGLRERFLALPASLQGLAYSAIGVAVFLFSTGGQRFIYFQF